MVNKVYEFQSGDLVTALFYDRQKKEFSWRLGLALKREKVHKRDRVAQKRWKICWGQDPLYSIVDFSILCEWLKISEFGLDNDNIEEMTSYHEANRSLIISTFEASSGATGPCQISNPMRDDILTDDLREMIITAVSGLTSEYVETAQFEIDKILGDVERSYVK